MNALESDLLQKVRLLLKSPDIQPETDTILHRLPGWDSLRMMNLLMQLEREWKLRFQAAEVARLRSWGDLLALVEKSTSDGRKNP